MGNVESANLLLNSASEGDYDKVKELITKGDNVNCIDENNVCALMRASENGHTEVARLLLQNGAQLNLQDKEGLSPLCFASQNGHTEVADLLLQNGAQVDLQDKEGWSPLCIASQNGHTEVADLLLKNGAQVDLQEKEGASPLFIASQYGRTEVSNLLLQNGAQVDMQMNDGASPLYIASQNGYTEVVKLLLQYGAQVYLINNDGHSAVTVAKENNHTDVITLLELTKELRGLQFQVDQLGEIIHAKDKTIQLKNAIIQAKDREVQGLTAELRELQFQIDRQGGIIHAKDKTIKLKNEIIQDKEREVRCLTAGNQSLILEKSEVIEQMIRVKEDELRAKDYQIIQLQQSLAGSERNAGNFLSSREGDSWNIPRAEVTRSLKKQIGYGAWGVVYSGKFRGEEVAIKQAHRDILQHVSTIDTLKREILIMAHIQHPNLVRFIGAVLDEAVERGQDTPIIISELLDINLRDAYSREDLSINLVPIFRDVAYALHYLHQHHQPIIHRDVSAPNVLLQSLPNNLYQAKVSDFGSANLAAQGVTAGVGAIIYCAPEMFPPTDITTPPPPQTTKVDVFSYGILLLEVILKEVPTTEKRSAMFQRIQKQWRTMYELIIHCTKHCPSDRPIMADILNKLHRHLH